MGLAIVDNTMSPTDRAFRLRNAIMTRRFYLPEDDTAAVGGSVGTNWTKILVGITCAFNVDASINIQDQPLGAETFFFGLQSGITQSDSFLLGGKHCIGVAAGIPVNDGWRVDATTSPKVGRYLYGSRIHRYRDGVEDNSGSLSGDASFHISSEPNVSRSFVLIQAEKTGGNIIFEFGTLMAFSKLPQEDFSDEELTLFMESLADISDINSVVTVPANKWRSNGWTVPNADTEQATYGWFDSVFMGWTGNSAKIQLDIFNVRYRVLT